MRAVWLRMKGLGWGSIFKRAVAGPDGQWGL